MSLHLLSSIFYLLFSVPAPLCSVLCSLFCQFCGSMVLRFCGSRLEVHGDGSFLAGDQAAYPLRAAPAGAAGAADRAAGCGAAPGPPAEPGIGAGRVRQDDAAGPMAWGKGKR